MAAGALFFVACSKVPDYVINPDDMAEILADIHTAEAVVELNAASYTTDSTRLALKQSILKRHGYTLADLDTSFVWYGAHLKEYDKVYDRTIEILNNRLEQVDAVAAANASMTVAGDSVDVWAGPRGFAVSNRSASMITDFSLKADANWKMGDAYTWRAKFVNNQLPARWNIAADYTDGTVEYLTVQFSGDGWKEVTFYADSTRTLKRVYGAMTVEPAHETSLYVDSMQLVRNRLNSRLYPQRYRQRTYKLD